MSLTIAENFAPSFVLNALAARPGSIVDEKEAMKNAKDDDLGNAWLSRNSAGSGPFTLRAWRAGEGGGARGQHRCISAARRSCEQVVFNHVRRSRRRSA